MKYLILPIFIILFFNACTNKQLSHNIEKNYLDEKVNKLSSLIIQSSDYIDRNEAKNFSKDAITYSMFLANKYEVDTHPLFHNTLINLNIKERGYCYHYTNDLKRFLNTKDYRSFKLKKIVSKRGEYFEHTSLALTRKDIKFEDSIVLDAWRDAGELYFSKIKDDKSYEWEIK